MNYEKKYYENEAFWDDEQWSWEVGREKFENTLNFIKDDVTSVLDLACGNGVFTNFLAAKKPNLRIVGMDRSETALKFVKTEKILGDINKIPFKDNEFDCVIANSVLEHLPVDIYNEAIKEIARISKKYIIISVPFEEVLKDKFTTCPSCETSFNLDLHLRNYNKQKINEIFKEQNITCVEIRTSDKVTNYYGHKLYVNLFFPNQNKKFNSPICPICGYENKELSTKTKRNTNTSKKSLIQLIRNGVKSLWPKYSFDYESTSLYIKA